ncbi:sulfatase [Pelagicoccus mobilis]|uniref:Sulfatase n=1 Tax=Pelagicoccus mobilis TaxID=415221 RepID=A0A934S1A5_9BACT|nr:sulfatase [Pelagicoccus mobilis]MBK1879179.1 sulfatase [Pelagicoccus mobilis]
MRLTLFILLTSSFILRSVTADDRPNFLFIAIDDLNDFAGYASEEPGNFLQTIYPDAETRKAVVKRLTPNLDKLASQGSPFLRAYCPSALCGPSRTSLMTGVSPHKSGYYMHSKHFRLYDTLKNTVTLPQQLRAHGYFTAGAGKIFHKPLGDAEGKLENDWADARYSWDTWINHNQGAAGKPSRYSPPKGGNMQFGPGKEPLKKTGDYQTADLIARVLENGYAKANSLRGKVGPKQIKLPSDKPFFLACGIFRPHLPFYAPQDFFDLFPTEEMSGLNRQSLDAIISDLKDLPSGAQRFTDFKRGKLRSIMDHANELEGAAGEIPAWRDMVQSYLASVAFADACLGRLLEGLENSEYADNTVVFLWSDHGYHLGTKFHIAKQAVWETANRVQLIIRDPRNPNASNGQARHQLASLNDMYPTICDLAGVPLPGPNVGRSLVSVLDSRDAEPVRNELVFTYMEGNHGLRTDRYAYLRYKDGSTELYDMLKDPKQLTNLAKNPEHKSMLKSLDQKMDTWLEAN